MAAVPPAPNSRWGLAGATTAALEDSGLTWTAPTYFTEEDTDG